MFETGKIVARLGNNLQSERQVKSKSNTLLNRFLIVVSASFRVHSGEVFAAGFGKELHIQLDQNLIPQPYTQQCRILDVVLVSIDCCWL